MEYNVIPDKETEFEEKVRKYLEENLKVYLDTDSRWSEDETERTVTNVSIEVWLGGKIICRSKA